MTYAIGDRVRVCVPLGKGHPDLFGVVKNVEAKPWGVEYRVEFDPGQWYPGLWAWITVGAMFFREETATPHVVEIALPPS